MTGGFAYGTDSHLSSTTEFVRLDGSSQYGPNLPGAMEKHCMVQINSSTIMFTGGYIRNGNVKATFFYDIDSQTFTTGPDSLKHREAHACGLVKDKGDGSRIVVMMGTNNGASTTSSEFLVEGSKILHPNMSSSIIKMFRFWRMGGRTRVSISCWKHWRNHSSWWRAIHCRWRLGQKSSWWSCLVFMAVWVPVHKQSLPMEQDGTRIK